MYLDFDIPQLRRFLSQAEGFKAFDHAKVSIADHLIQLLLHSKFDSHRLELRISCRELDYQLSSLAQVLSSSFLIISTLEELEIKEHNLSSPQWKDDMENAQWLELLEPFTSLRNLYLTDKIPLHVCDALQELSGETVTPALQNLFISPRYLLEGSQEVIKAFVAMRLLSGHPVSVHRGSRSEGWEDITEDLTETLFSDQIKAELLKYGHQMAYCDRCSRWFRDNRALQQHIENSNSHWVCDDCNVDFSSWSARREHYVHSRKHHFCGECDRHFSSDEARVQHMGDKHPYCRRHDKVRILVTVPNVY